MRLYLDTEFNGHCGELISLAIAAQDGDHFYGVVRCSDAIDPWVAVNVIPHLEREAEPFEQFRLRLMFYMKDREGAQIYADWPADFEHLLHAMCGSAYDVSWMVACSMHLLKNTEPEPQQPHNALSDAIALMQWHEKQGGLAA